MSRNFPLALLVLVVACGDGSQVSDRLDTTEVVGSSLTGTRVRLMAGNLSSGNLQSYDPGHGARIFQGVKPDVLMLQEFNIGSNSTADVRAFVDSTFGPTFSYARGAPAQIPNGVISRYPIISSGDWTDPKVSNRAFTWAQIDIPGPVDLWAISVHLLTSSAANRSAEATALVAAINSHVPAGDWVVIGGDFNTSSRTEAALSVFSSLFTVTGPFPADQNGNGNTNASRGKPYDWVIVSPSLNARAIPTVIGNSTYASGLVVDTRVYTPISEIAPALSGDSASVNMQHMGVVRDFDVPGTGGTGGGAGGGAGGGGGTVVGTVRVSAPNGGEAYLVGSSQTISWTSSNVSSVNVDYAADGVTFSRLASTVTASLGSVAWTVPATATTSAKVRVTDASNASVTDTSDAAFSVVVPTVRVTAPNGGESYFGGSSQTITWTSSNVTSVNVDYAADGASFSRLASGVSAAAGSLGWTVPTAATSSAKVRVTDATNSSVSDVSDAAFTVLVVTPAKVIINEILANEPGSVVAGEFVELYNAGGSAADLSSWSVSDATSVRHRFAAGTLLQPGARLVVFGASSGIPAGLTNAVGSSTGALSLGNSGDTVTVANSGGATIDSFTYTSALAGVDGVSMNRSPDRSATGTFVLHTTLSTLSSSPGVAVNGAP